MIGTLPRDVESSYNAATEFDDRILKLRRSMAQMDRFGFASRYLMNVAAKTKLIGDNITV